MLTSEPFGFDLTLGGSSTTVVIRPGALDDTGPLLVKRCGDGSSGKVMLVSDDRVGPLYAERVSGSLRGSGRCVHEFLVPAGERAKSLAQAGRLYDAFAKCGLGRDGIVLALGGGVVSDLAGFAAATWMRGVRFAICPTTLESDVDACLGGKTAISIEAGKNLVGAFHQPCLVVVDPLCLQTLDPRDVRAGMAESVKHALITSESFLAWHEANVDRLLAVDSSVVSELIARNLRIKGEIVSRDVFEQTGGRMVLNFGHTMGHAIETCSDYALRHGECVSLGMMAACRLAASLGLGDPALSARVERLLTRLSLPTQLRISIEFERLMAAMRLDKKGLNQGLRFVLLEDIGHPVIKTIEGTDSIRSAFESLVP